MFYAIVLDDDLDLRTVMLEVLLSIGIHDCIGVESEAAFRKLPVADVLRADLIFLDVNLGPHVPSGIDAYRYLVDIGFNGLIYFFTGHAKSHPLVEEAARVTSSKVKILEKPIGLEAFVDIIEKVRKNHA